MLIHFQFQMESQRDTILFLVRVEEKEKRDCVGGRRQIITQNVDLG